MNTAITNRITAANDKAQYDEYAKQLIAQKLILAYILVQTIDEFKGMQPEDVVSRIEGEPLIGVVPVEPGMTNTSYTHSSGDQLIGLNTENSEINEGMIRFDIIFYVRMKDGLAQVIINIEIQKDEPTQYFLLNRAIFYVSRMVSSQKGRDFVHQNYNDMKRVFSIWLCLNMDSHSMCHIHLTRDDLINHHNWKGNLDLLNIIFLGIGEDLPPQEEQYQLHRLIAALLSNQLPAAEKLKIIHNEYHIPLSQPLTEGVNMMCNLGEGIEERTAARVTKEVTKKVTKEVTKELNAKHAKHAKELTEKLAEKDRIISAYQLLAKHTPIAQIAAETGLSEEPSAHSKAHLTLIQIPANSVFGLLWQGF